MLVEPYLSDFRTKTEGFEGNVPYFYKDTRGFVSIGIGHLVSSLNAALALPWTDISNVQRDWTIIANAAPAKPAEFYEALTTSRLTPAGIMALFDQDIADDFTPLRGFIPTIDSMPQPCIQGILDMSLNLGPTKLNTDFFAVGCRFGPAVLRGDWATAAAECERKGISEARNAYTANLFRSAIGSVS